MVWLDRGGGVNSLCLCASQPPAPLLMLPGSKVERVCWTRRVRVVAH